jgi:small GTP-binding protein
MTIWDLGGIDKLRPLWSHHDHVSDVNAIVYVLDATDSERLSESKEALDTLLKDDLNAVPLLLFVNKTDLDDLRVVERAHCSRVSVRRHRTQVHHSTMLCDHWRWSQRWFHVACKRIEARLGLMGATREFVKKKHEISRMGACLSRRTRTRKRILVLGLDVSDKTSMLDTLRPRPGVVEKAVPTVGFNQMTLLHRRVALDVWDLGGQLQELWLHYCERSQAIVYVVDLTDRERMEQSVAALDKVLTHADLAGDVPLLLFANKCDRVDRAVSTEEIVAAFELDERHERKWTAQRCCATNGEGLYAGFDWLADTLSS